MIGFTYTYRKVWEVLCSRPTYVEPRVSVPKL
jgi:hypothetical protein